MWHQAVPEPRGLQPDLALVIARANSVLRMRRSSGAYIVLRVHLESIGNSARATSKRFPFGQPAFHRRRVWSPDQDRMRVSCGVGAGAARTVRHRVAITLARPP
jgi:hypothetical protein